MVLLHSIYYVRKYCFQTANAEEEPSAATERKRSRETFHQAQLQLFRRLTAAQFIRLVTSGFVNISLHAKLIPLFHENVKLPSGLHTRSMISLRSIIFQIISPAQWSKIYQNACLNLSQHANAEKLAAELRQQTSKKRSNNTQRTDQSFATSGLKLNQSFGDSGPRRPYWASCCG